MKYNIQRVLLYMPWLFLLFGVDIFAVLLLWLADIQAFYSMIFFIVFITIFFFSGVCGILIRLERKREQAFFDFLYTPDEYHEELLLETIPSIQREKIHLLGRLLRDKQNAFMKLQIELKDYEEYIESWAHETKTPISLLTLLLDNRREELSTVVSFRLDYIRNRIQESIDQILFYARLKGTRKDYLFEFVSIRMCVESVLEEYKPLLEEKQFQIQFELFDEMVYSDRRGFCFLLKQVVSNAIKYCKKDPNICFSCFEKENFLVLSIKDNGIGVHSCDLPYIFEKGFTGNSGLEKKATGMGLYLAKEMARELNINLDVNTEWENGFEMQIFFPIVNLK